MTIPVSISCPVKIVDGTAFHPDTPDRLIALLNALRITGERVTICYGDVIRGVKWQCGVPDRGTIGRSIGTHKVPLLITTKRSRGGEAIMTSHIVEIRRVGGEVIYNCKDSP